MNSALQVELPVTRLVAAPRALRKLAVALVACCFIAALVLIFVPWQQNLPGQGQIVALDPLDRIQTLPAPVKGRLVKLNVQEGDFVEKGEILAVMADQDPLYSTRLQQQYEFSNDKVQAARGQVEFYDQQLRNQEDGKRHALDSAQFDLNGAIEKVKAEERVLEAEEAELEQKRADRNRKWRLFQEGVVSELDNQKAEAAFLSARAKVEKAKNQVEQARNAEKAKLTDLSRLANDLQAKIDSTQTLRQEARSKAAAAEKELTESLTKIERQNTQEVTATRAGYILRVHAARSADFISQGEPLIDLIPDAKELAAELWVGGNDAPLIAEGRKVRLQFEGYPAVQWSGWPSVAVGTFGGIVRVVDRQAGTNNRFRVLVTPDPEDDPWPERTFLRQGTRANGWIMLNSVRLGFEIWRQLNAFPVSVKSKPDGSDMDTGDKGSAKSKGKKS